MKKKTVSLMLAGVLFASMPLTVSASALTAPGSADVSTEGTVNYVDTTVYSVELPTAGCFNFTIDPQGILSATDPTTYPADKYPAGTAGYIVATEGTGAYIKNQSSVPIKLLVDAYVTNDDTNGTASSVNLLSLAEYGAGLTNSGIDNNMMLSFDITGETADGSMLADATGITRDTVIPNVIAVERNSKPDPAANEVGTQISFALNSAAYKFNGTAGAYTYDLDTTAAQQGDAVGMRLSGFVNTNADWSAYTGSSAEKIIVKTVFSFDKLGTDYAVAALDGRAHGVLADIDANYFAGLEYDANGLPTGNTAAGAMEYTVGTGALVIPFDLGSGTKELKITAVDVGGALDAADYKVANGTITVKTTAATVKAVTDAATVAGTPVAATVTTSDGKVTTINITVYGTNP